MDATTPTLPSTLPRTRHERSVTPYTRRDVLRILHLREAQLAAWERAGIFAPAHHYDFEDLSQLRTLRNLRARRISARSIRRHMEAMQRVAGIGNPLLEAAAVGHGSRVVFRHGGALVDPITQQLAFDFGATAGRPLCVGPGQSPARWEFDLQETFLRAVRLEEVEATRAEAARLYEQILLDHPSHAASAINLGTIRYGQRLFAEAERLYRRATVADPEYALAFFDLGNVLDEMRRLDDAIDAYRRALALVPQYADAHYNLALAYERKGERRRALRHWLMYVRLDPEGPWATHARGQAKKILSGERLTIVSRRGRLTAC